MSDANNKLTEICKRDYFLKLLNSTKSQSLIEFNVLDFELLADKLSKNLS